MTDKNKKGKVILVGAGPGDPGLITVKAVDAIRSADVLVYDYLANPVFLNYAAPETEKIYVGKQAGQHYASQDQINELIVKLALEGKRVVRLKGGDPFVFGRGGEEAFAALEYGIKFEIIPGVTAGVAVPAYAGIPVTHRGVSAAVAFITGHEDPTKDDSDIDWEGLARFHGTLVFYMGLGNLGNIRDRLTDHGVPGSRPAAVIHRGTVPAQRTVHGTLDNIEQRVVEQKLKAPALIVIGDVVSLSSRLGWFENRPLFGRTVLITRTREQAGDLNQALGGYGADVIEFPTIKISDPPDTNVVDSVAKSLGGYDTVIFTSVNGVERFMERLFAVGGDSRSFAGVKICAIGPATSECVRKYGLRVDIIPETYVAESVVEALKADCDLSGKKVLLPRAEVARSVIPDALKEAGAEVDVVPVYTTVVESPDNTEEVRGMLERGEIDVLTFTSSSTVENLVQILGPNFLKSLDKLPLVASIGPITAETASGLGIGTDIMPDEFTIPALTAAIVSYYSEKH